LQTHASS